MNNHCCVTKRHNLRFSPSSYLQSFTNLASKKFPRILHKIQITLDYTFLSFILHLCFHFDIMWRIFGLSSWWCEPWNSASKRLPPSLKQEKICPFAKYAWGKNHAIMIRVALRTLELRWSGRWEPCFLCTLADPNSTAVWNLQMINTQQLLKHLLTSNNHWSPQLISFLSCLLMKHFALSSSRAPAMLLIIIGH